VSEPLEEVLLARTLSEVEALGLGFLDLVPTVGVVHRVQDDSVLLELREWGKARFEFPTGPHSLPKDSLPEWMAMKGVYFGTLRSAEVNRCVLCNFVRLGLLREEFDELVRLLAAPQQRAEGTKP